MIRLRRMLERGRAHPLLGPILLIVLALLLSLVFLHVADDANAVTEIGAACLALATMLGLPLVEGLCGRRAEPLVAVRGDRGPPLVRGAHMRPAVVAARPQSLPLRR